ncbi:peptidoglycan-associated lipoprotein Pal [Exilibacterium tricleocarpae]|uniref:Peptidoglycan-associated lipoprotein n=1 Tax=Exilibacterium tricleocarpae TaxID=2591008 RepID=A0A545U9G5_9GAMM|nr:peptidoglycan-associated lipoprotein Pal [Exilibacterium tricleocarpae]TQV86114.1 peptidoglycan-associated lipoprotein Pal [Exilibacterium tricleocarpae]
MGIKTLKHGLGLVCVMAVLAGCSSAPEVEEPPVTTPEPEVTESGSGIDDPGFVSEPVPEPVVELDTVFYFEFDKAELLPEARAALTAHAERLKADSRSIRLEGHADERGTREYNMALGERRANAVRDFLVLQGVSSSFIETVSYGEEYPAVVGSYESAWEQNRRVELK